MALDPYCAVYLHGKYVPSGMGGGEAKGVLVPITSSVPLSFIKSRPRYEPRRFRLPSANVYPRVLSPYPSVIGGSSASRFLRPPPIVDLSNRDDKTACWAPDLTENLQQTAHAQRELPNLNQISGIADFHVMIEATRDGALVDIQVRRRQTGVYRRRF